MTLAVGYDGGESAEHALTVAIDLAKDLGESLLVVCAVAPPGNIGDEYHAMEEAVIEALSPAVMAGVQRARAAGVDAEPLLVDDEPVGALEAVTASHAPRMLIIGYGAAGQLRAALFAAVAPHLLARSEIPVLVVP